MTPLGYFRALEKLLTIMRDNVICDLGMSDEGKALEKKLNDAADAIDQAWSELSKADQLMVYNMAKHLTDNVKPKDKAAEPESSVILLN